MFAAILEAPDAARATAVLQKIDAHRLRFALTGGHVVSFDEAVTVFLDASALDGPDLRHSTTEPRFLRLGRAADGRVLIVAYTLRSSDNAETIRIISARRASRRERAAYDAQD